MPAAAMAAFRTGPVRVKYRVPPVRLSVAARLKLTWPPDSRFAAAGCPLARESGGELRVGQAGDGAIGRRAKVGSRDDSRRHLLAPGSPGAAARGGARRRGIGAGGAVALGGLLLGRRDDDSRRRCSPGPTGCRWRSGCSRSRCGTWRLPRWRPPRCTGCSPAGSRSASATACRTGWARSGARADSPLTLLGEYLAGAARAARRRAADGGRPLREAGLTWRSAGRR